MNRIQQIKISLSRWHPIGFVYFLDEIDLDNNLQGKCYKPGFITYQHLRLLASEMDVDLNLIDREIILTRRNANPALIHLS